MKLSERHVMMGGMLLVTAGSLFQIFETKIDLTAVAILLTGLLMGVASVIKYLRKGLKND